MTILPAKYNITIPQRATFRIQITLPFDCTNYTVEAQVWDKVRLRKYLDFDVEWVDRAEVVPDTDPVEYKGRFNLFADWEDTSLVRESGQWDLLVVDDISGDRYYYLEGTAKLDPGYTGLGD